MLTSVLITDINITSLISVVRLIHLALIITHVLSAVRGYLHYLM